MVKGLDIFKEYFSSYDGQYLLIGGTACDLVMTAAGQSFRATHDLDIVLCAEALTDEFVSVFWQFIKAGNYSSRERSDGEKQFYRFKNPQAEGFPKEIELFSRKPDTLSIPDDCVLTPIPTGEDISSLSAIILDEDYYAWIQKGGHTVDGLPVVGAEYLIPLKIKAWLDLSKRKREGESIDSRKIRKHPYDVFRLYTILPIRSMPDVPDVVRQDVRAFVQEAASVDVDFKNLGLGQLTTREVIDGLTLIYGVGN